MNDFTKEELKQILGVFARCPALMDIPDDRALMNKIAKISNNYCEQETKWMCGLTEKQVDHICAQECAHESDGQEYCPGLFEKVLCASDLTPKDLLRFYKCKKCGEFYR